MTDQPPEAAETLEVGPPPGRKRGIAVGATAAVLALLAGVAVYAAGVLSGGGRQPDDLVPKTTFAYLKVDLDPAANQKLAAREFFGHFPKLKSGTSSTNQIFENVLDDAFAGAGPGEIDFKTDVQPWFDRRAAVAAFPGAHGDPLVVGVLRSKDDGAARAALDKAAARIKAKGGGELAYRIAKGYAVVSNDRTAVDESLRQSDDASLGDNETYRDDVDALPGDQIAVAWLDAKGSFAAAKDLLPSVGLAGLGLDAVKGRAAAGIHLTGNYAEISGRTFGMPVSTFRGGDPALLRNLPADTVAAFSFEGLDKALRDGLAATPELGLIANGFLSDADLSLDKDVLALLGNQTVLALGSIAADDLSRSKAALVSAVADPEKAAAAGRKLAGVLNGIGLPVRSKVVGKTFYLAMPGGYADELAKGRGLGDTAAFKTAMGDLGQPSAAVYVDMKRLFTDEPDPNFRALTSLGIVAGVKDGNGFFRVRLVVG